jgi:tyrosine-protein kinase Etk/Wzc
VQPHLLPPGLVQGATASDTIDVADVVRTLRRQWRAVIGFIVLGVLAAAAVVLFAPRRFDGKVTVLARPGAQAGGSVSGRMGGLGELLGGLGGLGLQGSIETELQVLKSRALAGQVVDSLQLQIVPREPRGLPAARFVSASSLNGRFAPRVYQFARQPDGSYRVRGGAPDRDFQAHAGVASAIDVGSITINPGAPERFSLRVMDREDAITRFSRRLAASKAGGDIAKISYRGDDSVSAAAAANMLVHFYLERRRTTDRGVNERRVEYVTAQLDATAAELARTERELRRQQEASRVFDAEIFGEVELTAAAEMRQTLTDLQVEEGAIRQLLSQADAGRVTSRDLAAYPAFMKGTSVSPMAQQLSDLEARRIALLERRTERDPEVVAIDNTITALQANIAGMVRSYAASITRQREQLQQRVDSVHATLLALPAAAERGGRLKRDVMRLTQIYTALEAQLVEARLAAIGEGGDVRQIDVAVPARKPSFPQPLLTMGIGTAGGLMAGLVAALFLGWFGRWLRDPAEVERAIGIAAQRADADMPLLVAATAGTRSVLVVPLDGRTQTSTVAERLARTARQRAIQATVLDLSTEHAGGGGNGKAPVDSLHVARMLDDIEQQNAMTVVQLPALMSDVTMAVMRETRPVVLVAPPGPVDRTRLAGAVDALRRLNVPCAGVVLSEVSQPRLRAPS